MKKTEIISRVSGTINKVGLQLRKHAPEILVVAGVVGTVASAVMACRATTKISMVLEKTKDDIDKIHDCLADEALADEYSEEDGKKDLAIVYIQTGAKLAALYAPSVLLGALSITSILASNSIHCQRNIALAAAYATVDKGFKEYRGRVVDKFGEEIDRELKYNIKAMKYEETVTDETGKEEKVETIVNIADPNEYSDYARFFDEESRYWEKDSEYNLLFLKAQQQFANDLLRSRGHLFLNEVYDMLDIPRTKAGQIVGWVYKPDDNSYKGANYVDFGIYDINRETHRNFVNGYERSILLDFNIDGNIMDLI